MDDVSQGSLASRRGHCLQLTVAVSFCDGTTCLSMAPNTQALPQPANSLRQLEDDLPIVGIGSYFSAKRFGAKSDMLMSETSF